ncbi:N-acetylgalactosamine-6-sulfatase [Rhodopirellula bahusiensis]|uniref:N-acetylgalactosamine-6-sulfatase n=1 Tax=Rhodopirellula bahusiensis TaxID=2014065 RepID=A0A2G1WDA3_9BACT|nr:N-acetylgalactosamine-6-sulfatase [Rhodopirellula bahusiensis]
MNGYPLVLLLLLSFTFGQCVCADEATPVSPAEPVRGTTSARPNIVIVYTDDQAAWAVGTAVQRGWFDDVAKAATPNIDRLASEGAIFRNFFCTTPVCSPARAAFMTGRYASEFGITDFIPQPGHKLYDEDNQVALDPDKSITFAEVLQQNGYQTGLVGKWHLGDWTAKGSERLHPTHHGFDYFMGLTGGGTTPSNPELEEEGKVRKFTGLTIDILADRALKFIERSRDKPFLLCLNTRAPHGAWLPVAPEDWQPYDGLDAKIPNPDYPDLNITKMKKQMREYLASTGGVDRNIGRVLGLLDELQLVENTVVIFTSDHGYNMGHNGFWHKGNGIWATRQPPRESHRGTRAISAKYRPNLDDHSLRVPMIIRWPGVVKAGTEIESTATSLDFFPTVLNMTRLALPENLRLRGRTLLPLLKGKAPPDWDQNLYAEYHMTNYAHADLRCYRTPQFKLVVDSRNAGRNEFFDLKADPGETRNLIADHSPEIQSAIKKLTQRLESTRSEIENAHVR